MKKDSWTEFIRSVTPINNSNKYIPPPQEYQYPISAEALRFLRKQQRLINAMPVAEHELGSFSRRQKRRFRYEAKLDLHDKFNDVDTILDNFCSQCIINNIKFITIITGKGRGIILTNTIEWLRSHTHLVSEYFEIRDSNNACGSIGVKLKTHRNYV